MQRNPMEAEQDRADRFDNDASKSKRWNAEDCKCESTCETCDFCNSILEGNDPS